MIKNDGKLYIEKHTFTEWLTIYIFAVPFMLSFVIDFLNVPSFFKYTLDLCWVTVLVILTFRKTWRIEKQLTPFIIQMVVWLLTTRFKPDITYIKYLALTLFITDFV